MKKKLWIVGILILLLIGFSQTKKEKEPEPTVPPLPIKSTSQVEIPKMKEETEEIRKELIEFLDAYEACIDEYISFMSSYDSSDFSSLAEYLKLTEAYLNFGKKAEEWKDTDMNDKELLYYAERINNITIKLLKASSETEENK